VSDEVCHRCYWTVAGLGEETIKRVLRNSGLTEKEAEVYIFLARHDVRKGTEIASLLRKDKAQVFRILRRLQAKGFVEATLDFPTRFTIVPFENVIDSIVKAKQEEVAFIKETKKDLLDYLSQKRQVTPLEKFVVIKGNKRIYSKISQIIKDTKQQLSVATTVTDLLRGDCFGVLDVAFNHTLSSQIKFRFLTEISNQNINALKALIERVPETSFKFKVRNPDLGLSLFPRMVTRDNEEILFFTTPRTDKTGKNDVCLWTNCKTLVRTFTVVFEDLWHNSIDLQTKIAEIETEKLTARTSITANAKTNEKKYEKILCAAEKEIIMMTFTKNLVDFWHSTPPLKEWAEQGVSVKIMVPITIENFEVAKQLSEFCEVRHTTVDQMGTTIIDGKHLFQFKKPLTTKEEQKLASPFKTQFYTDDLEYINKVKATLDYLWRNARAPSAIMLAPIIQPPPAGISSPSDKAYTYGPDRPNSPYRKLAFPIERKPGTVTEKEVLDKIINGKKHIVNNSGKDRAVLYGKQALAVIHPPDYLNLPEMIIQVFTFNDNSSFGAENWLRVFLQLETPMGKAFKPVAHIQDHTLSMNLATAVAAGTPLAENLQVFKEGEFQIQAQGNVLFAGWTRFISLLSGKYTLPPCCLLFDGYGEIKPGVIRISSPNGFEEKWEYNGLEAFVTFFHPSSKYSGPGTDGRLSREIVITGYPPAIKPDKHGGTD
jgi:sugar-specific transcriptional regulator TrmB